GSCHWQQPARCRWLRPPTALPVTTHLPASKPPPTGRPTHGPRARRAGLSLHGWLSGSYGTRWVACSVRLDAEEHLAVLDWIVVLDKHLAHHACNLCLDLVHQLHRLDDAQNGARFDAVTYAHVGRSVGRR